MNHSPAEVRFRVRYSEIDRMGTFYNSRALEWFEYGRVELLRAIGVPYDKLERRGYCLPLIEAHVEYLSRAGFGDLLGVTAGVRGYTIHAVTDPAGKPVRPPEWFMRAVRESAGE